MPGQFHLHCTPEFHASERVKVKWRLENVQVNEPVSILVHFPADATGERDARHREIVLDLRFDSDIGQELACLSDARCTRRRDVIGCHLSLAAEPTVICFAEREVLPDGVIQRLLLGRFRLGFERVNDRSISFIQHSVSVVVAVPSRTAARTFIT